MLSFYRIKTAKKRKVKVFLLAIWFFANNCILLTVDCWLFSAHRALNSNSLARRARQIRVYLLQTTKKYDKINLRHKILLFTTMCVYFYFGKNTSSIFTHLVVEKSFVSQQTSYVFFMRSFGCAFFIYCKFILNMVKSFCQTKFYYFHTLSYVFLHLVKIQAQFNMAWSAS